MTKLWIPERCDLRPSFLDCTRPVLSGSAGSADTFTDAAKPKKIRQVIKFLAKENESQ
jgi:hypothetical protein